MKKSLIACLVASVLLVGCNPKELTPDEKNQVKELQTQLTQTETALTEAAATDKQFSGGLIKSLNTAKTEVLETNKALLQQRINAIESGAKIEVTVPAVKPNPEAAAALQKEIDNLKSEIEAAKAEAAQYSGGLVLSLKLAGIATQEQTLAMLQMKYLSAKYGLAEVTPIKLAADDQQSAKKDQKKEPEKAEPKLPPANGPFGLEVGLTKENIEDMAGVTLEPLEGQTGLYMASSLPKNNAAFSFYALRISPNVGLCQIRAVGKDLDADSYGIEVQSNFDQLRGTLNTLYGNGKKSDYLMPGSIWRDAKDWMMGLNQKERVLNATWDKPNDVMIKNKITSVYLDARTQNASKAFLYLQYDFDNVKSCEQEEKEAQKNSL